MDLCIEKLNISEPDSIVNWHERFTLYVQTNDKITEDNRTAFYLTLIGKEGYDLLKDLSYPTPPHGRTIDELKRLLVAHLKPVNFAITERAKFHTIIRDKNESFRQFIRRLQHQSARCNFEDQLNTQLLDQIVTGVNNPDVQRRLLREENLDYVRARQILEAWDDVNLAVHDTSTSEVMFGKLSLKSPRHHKSRSPSTSTPPKRSTKINFTKAPCNSCGGAHLRSTCRFRSAECHKCQRKGHIAKVCRSSSQPTHKSALVDVQEENDYNVFTVSNNSSHLYHQLNFPNGRSLSFILDTGSPVSFFSEQDASSIGLNVSTTNPKSTIKGVSGHTLPILGEVTVPVQDNKSDPIPLRLLVTQHGPRVLGLDGLRALNVNVVLANVSRPTPPSLTPQLTTLIKACSSNTGGMRVTPVHLEATAPPRFLKARPMAYGIRPAVLSNLQGLVNDGILRQVQSSSWATPIVTPLKANGLPRICGDYRITINPHLKQTSSTTPDVDDMFSGLEGLVCFSKIDLANAFLQLPLDEDSKELTTINTMWGLYQYNFLPFGLNVSPGLFQAVMNTIIAGLSNVRAYQDDLIVFSSAKDKHDDALIQLLQRLKKFNVQINATKSIFGVNRIHYLGYVIDGTGISPDIERISALNQAPVPSTAEKLRSFLGFVQYYSKFVPNFAASAKPLFDSLSLPEFQWSDELDGCYKQLIQRVVNGKVLRSFSTRLYTELIVDASEFAIGAVLEQCQQPVICISRLLSKAERNYSQTQKEALAIVWAVKRLHKYLFNHRFRIVSDHKALQHLFSPDASVGKATSSMLQQWSIELSAYTYDVEYRPGKLIPQADYLSRHAHHQPPIDDEEYTLLVNPLPIDRNHLIAETKLAYGSVLAATRNGWSLSAKKKFPTLHSLREEMSLTPDGVLMINERILIPPSCRLPMLQHLHMGHLGRDKMMSLARLLCYWPSINADIQTFLKQAEVPQQLETMAYTIFRNATNPR